MKNLTNIIYKYRDNKLEYGKLDCCIFTAKVVEEYYDINLPLWKDILTYDNYIDAIKVLKKNNINSIEDLPTAILGKEKLPITEAKPGYPVYKLNKDGQGLLGICNGIRSYFLHPEHKLVALLTEDCMYCWRVR